MFFTVLNIKMHKLHCAHLDRENSFIILDTSEMLGNIYSQKSQLCDIKLYLYKQFAMAMATHSCFLRDKPVAFNGFITILLKFLPGQTSLLVRL